MTDLVPALSDALAASYYAGLAPDERAALPPLPAVEVRGRAAVIPTVVTDGPGGCVLAWPEVYVWVSACGVFYVLKVYPDWSLAERRASSYLNYNRPCRFLALGDALAAAVEV